MSTRRQFLGIAATAILATGAPRQASSHAQQNAGDPTPPYLVDGYVSGFGRIYGPAVPSTPAPDEVIAPMDAQLSMMGITFASEEFAARWFEEVVAAMAIGVNAGTPEALEVGDEAAISRVDLKPPLGYNEYVAMRIGPVVIVTGVFTFDADPEPFVGIPQAMAEFAANAQITTPNVTLREDGTSTGGVFDLMPTAEDADMLNGHLPRRDATAEAWLAEPATPPSSPIARVLGMAG